MSEFWTSGIIYNSEYKHEYSVLNSIWPKGGLSEFWKNALYMNFSDCVRCA